MPRRAILQIGTEKTGTTTLQRFLSVNRARLAERGFVYPTFCGARNHTGLAALALDPDRTDPIREPFGVRSPADVEALRARMRVAAAEELVGDATAIFCNEHCHSRLTSPAEVRTLRDFLGAFFDDVQICIYLRRQDRVALSLYSTRLKSGGVEPNILPRTNAQDPYFNYDKSLALWEDAFGAGNVRVRLFDRRTLTGGSIVTDFLASWAIGPVEDFLRVPDTNESIRPVAQEYLRRINPHLGRVAGLPLEDVRGPLASALASLLPGQGAKPGRAQAEAFYAMFAASNEAVRQRHFPDREHLFDEDFADYPDAGDASQASVDDLMAVAAQLHMAAIAETRRLEAEIAVREARLHLARSEPAAAEAALTRALGWRPDHAGAHRTMAEHLFRLERLEEAIEAATRATEFGPGTFEYWHFLGILRRRSGELDLAAAAQARALALNPGHAPSRREAEQVRLRQAAAQRPGPSQPFPTDGAPQCQSRPSA